MSKILVTGGNGFLGSNVASHLSDVGHAVRISTRAGGALVQDIEVASGCDLESEAGWQEALEGIDVVVHCAARVHVLKENEDDPQKAFNERNVDATVMLAQKAALAGVRRFIFISSIGVNGSATRGVPFEYDDLPSPEGAYAISKLAAEEALKAIAAETDLEVVFIRPPLVYGYNAPGNFEQLVKLVNSNIPLPLGSLENRRSFISVDNLADFINVVISHPDVNGQVFLVRDGTTVSTTDFIKAIKQAQGRGSILLPVPQAVLKLLFGAIGKQHIFEKLCGDLEINMDHTQRVTGWSPPYTMQKSISASFR